MRKIVNIILGSLLFINLGFMIFLNQCNYKDVIIIICSSIYLVINNSKAKPLEAALESLRVVEYLGKFSVEKYIDTSLFISNPHWREVDKYGGCFHSGIKFNSLEEANDFIEKLTKGKIIHNI